MNPQKNIEPQRAEPREIDFFSRAPIGGFAKNLFVILGGEERYGGTRSPRLALRVERPRSIHPPSSLLGLHGVAIWSSVKSKRKEIVERGRRAQGEEWVVRTGP
jgi:hypothetical protein